MNDNIISIEIDMERLSEGSKKFITALKDSHSLEDYFVDHFESLIKGNVLIDISEVISKVNEIMEMEKLESMMDLEETEDEKALETIDNSTQTLEGLHTKVDKILELLNNRSIGLPEELSNMGIMNKDVIQTSIESSNDFDDDEFDDLEDDDDDNGKPKISINEIVRINKKLSGDG